MDGGLAPVRVGPQTIQRAVSDEYKYRPKAAHRQGRRDRVGLAELAAQYLVPISNGRLEEWTRRVIAGETTVEDYKAYLQKQATSLFPELADEIKSGDDGRRLPGPVPGDGGADVGDEPERGLVDWTRSGRRPCSRRTTRASAPRCR
jgi:hypothetical protein